MARRRKVARGRKVARRRKPVRPRKVARRRKPAREPRFTVDASLSAFDLPRAGSALRVKIRDSDGELVGTLDIGQGSMRWHRVNGKKPRSLTWTDFFDRADRLFGR